MARRLLIDRVVMPGTRRHSNRLRQILVSVTVTAAAGACLVAGSACGDGGRINGLEIDHPGSARLGLFDFELSGDQLRIHHAGRDQPVFESPAGVPFVTAAAAVDDVESLRGSFTIRDQRLYGCPNQRVAAMTSSDDLVLIRGAVAGPECRADYELRFTLAGDATLRFELRVEDPELNRIALTAASSPEDSVLGFGTQYSHVDVNGRRVPVWVREQGIGRGLEPLTSLMNLTSPGSGGDWHTTYAPMPFYVTSTLQSLALETSEYAEFDFTRDDLLAIEQWSSRMAGRIYAGQTPLDVVRLHTELTGRMEPLPAWTQNGAVVRVHGGSQSVRDAVQLYADAGVPLSAVWIEDWVGERDTVTGNRLWWNWVVDDDLYPDWPELVAELDGAGIRTLIYFNPFLVDAADKENATRNLYAEAAEAGYLVRSPEGGPYLIGQGGFDAAMVDLSNPEARRWFQDLIEAQLAIGVDGWMADFGEALPYDAVLHDGDARSAHNLYPVEWASLNDEVIGSMSSDAVAFHRSGYTGSPQYVGLYWLGDQTVSWDEFDGIKTVVRGLISSGISGMSLNHSDIGGYLSVDLGNIQLLRSRELLERWIELAAFTPLFRTHETNERDKNLQVYSEPALLAHFARMTGIYTALAGYRAELMEEAARTGAPVLRHTWLVAPEEPESLAADQQFFLGPDVVVAPVLDDGAEQVQVYLPAGEWIRAGSGTGASTSQGEWKSASAPVGEPAVFYRESFDHADALEAAWAP